MANSVDPDEMQHYAAFHQGLHWLVRLKQPSGTEIHHNLENSTCAPLKYTMDILIINLRQYIVNLTSFCTVAFHWLTSKYMHLASCFMQLVATGRIGATKNISSTFWRKNVKSALEWEQPYSKFSFGEVDCRIYVRKSCFTAPLTRHHKTKFPTVYPMIYLPKWKFWIQLSPNWHCM